MAWQQGLRHRKQSGLVERQDPAALGPLVQPGERRVRQQHEPTGWRRVSTRPGAIPHDDGDHASPIRFPAWGEHEARKLPAELTEIDGCAA
jgi:hypothetical protein